MRLFGFAASKHLMSPTLAPGLSVLRRLAESGFSSPWGARGFFSFPPRPGVATRLDLPEASFLFHALDLIVHFFLGAREVEGGFHDSFATLGGSCHAFGERADGGHAIAVGVGRDGREVIPLEGVDVAFFDDVGQLEAYLCDWGI